MDHAQVVRVLRRARAVHNAIVQVLVSRLMAAPAKKQEHVLPSVPPNNLVLEYDHIRKGMYSFTKYDGVSIPMRYFYSHEEWMNHFSGGKPSGEEMIRRMKSMGRQIADRPQTKEEDMGTFGNEFRGTGKSPAKIASSTSTGGGMSTRQWREQQAQQNGPAHKRFEGRTAGKVGGLAGVRAKHIGEGAPVSRLPDAKKRVVTTADLLTEAMRKRSR